MMRKVFLTSVLLLVLILISTTPTVAKGPPRIERYVDFDGALDGYGKLYVDEKGKNIAIYGRMPMFFNFEPDGVEHIDFGLRITLEGKEPGKVNLYSGFDVRPWDFHEGCVKNIAHRYFEGSGFFYSYGEGAYEVTLNDAAIYDVVASTNKKCQGYGLEYVETDTFSVIKFTVKIDD